MTHPCTVFNFPVIHESVYFAIAGAFIDKATLNTNNVILGVIKPNYNGYDIDNDAPPMIDLKFFDDKPFHGALAAMCNPTVTIYTRDKRLPSLMMRPVDTLTWDKVNADHFYDNVIAMSESGNKELILAYYSNKCGFIRKI